VRLISLSVKTITIGSAIFVMILIFSYSYFLDEKNNIENHSWSNTPFYMDIGSNKIEKPNDGLFKKMWSEKIPSKRFDDGLIYSNYYELKPKSEMQGIYDEIGVMNESHKSIVVFPIFTAAAYSEPGFYTYFRNECDTSCLEVNLKKEYQLTYESSAHTVQALSILGYDFISDIDVDLNPQILEQYDKVILLHNEYVTKKEFEAITNHKNVVYLVPNALYAEISVDYEQSTINLIRGHGYPSSEISNGFDWEFDNTHPYEFDTECKDWKFYAIDNGHMLNCYPENAITNTEILMKIKEF